MAETPLLDKINAGDTLSDSLAIHAALRLLLPEAEKVIGEKFVLECDERGWSITYTQGNSYRYRLTPQHGYRFYFAEDAIRALVELIAANKAEIEREETANA